MGFKIKGSISSAKKRESISLISCCNTQDIYLHRYCIFQDKNQKLEQNDGMLLRSRIRMLQKLAYVTGEIFLYWLTTHKLAGKVLVILDGHTSHTTNLEMLQTAEKDVIFVCCLPSHIMHFLRFVFSNSRIIPEHAFPAHLQKSENHGVHLQQFFLIWFCLSQVFLEYIFSNQTNPKK